MLLRDQIIRADDYLTDSLPDYAEPHEPADWLTLCDSDQCPVMIDLNGRSVLLCYTSSLWSDEQLTAVVESLRESGHVGLAGWRGCPQSVVLDARHDGAMVMLDAPVSTIWHVVGITLESE